MTTWQERVIPYFAKDWWCAERGDLRLNVYSEVASYLDGIQHFVYRAIIERRAPDGRWLTAAHTTHSTREAAQQWCEREAAR